jgi:hypothetical protein
LSSTAVNALVSPATIADIPGSHPNRPEWLPFKSALTAGNLGRNSLKHIKTFISAVFKLAKQQGYFIGENSVRDIAIRVAHGMWMN